MPASHFGNAHGSAFNTISRWWQNWKNRRSELFFDFDNCSEDELKRTARHLGIPIGQLRWIARYSPDPAALLERRMEALCLDPNEVAHTEPLTFRELQRHCAKCERRGRCALDLADRFSDPAWQNWEDYCPNAATLKMLRTLQSCSEVYK